MGDRYTLGIVGCGRHARYTLAPLWKDIPEIEPVAASDVHPQSLSDFADDIGIANTYADVDQMLSEQQPDILVVASWPASHLDNVLAGIRGGVKAIFCEKPLALNASQAKEMVQAAKAANVLLMEGFMSRYHPQLLAVKQHLLDGAIGELRYMRASFSTGTADQANWRLRGELGGGAAMDLGCYCLSGIRYQLGGEPLSVRATGTFDDAAGVWKTLMGTLHFTGEVKAQFDCSFGLPRRGSYEVVGTEGTIVVPVAEWSLPKDPAFSYTLSHGDRADLPPETVNITGVNPYREQLLDLCNALSTGNPPRLAPDDAVANMRVIDAVHESARTGQPVEIPAED
jgi:xylose dehydrogenase (NAD/NADP)